MKELVERFIREHPEHQCNITKNENEFLLNFFIGNDLYDLSVSTNYEILKRKYQDLQNKNCAVCFDDVDNLCRCKFCGFKVCKDCIRKLEFFNCPCCRNDQFFFNFERSIFNHDTTLSNFRIEHNENKLKLKEEIKDISNLISIIHDISTTVPNEKLKELLFNSLLNSV